MTWATGDRAAIADRIASERGLTLVRPFDDRFIIAGQGTVGLEAIEDAASLGIVFDAFVAPASGGGLIAGCALACDRLSPGTRIYTAEPIGLDDHARSLASGTPVGNLPGAHSICDALLGTIPGEITFAVQPHAARRPGLVVADEEDRAAGIGDGVSGTGSWCWSRRARWRSPLPLRGVFPARNARSASSRRAAMSIARLLSRH